MSDADSNSILSVSPVEVDGDEVVPLTEEQIKHVFFCDFTIRNRERNRRTWLLYIIKEGDIYEL